MTQYDLGQVVGADGQDGVDGSDGSTIWYTSTAPTYANSKYTFTISNLTGKTGFTIAVNDLIFYDTYYYIVSTVNSTTVDCATRVSIKGSDASVTVVDNLNSDSSTSVLSAKQGKVLNTNKIETSAIATSFGNPTSDSKVPSEKLVKTELDKKIATSSTTGLVKNDGSIDTTPYSTFSGSYTDLSNKPTIPSASSTTPSADTTSGSYGSGTSYARSNHTHPKSSLYAESSHTHTKSQITDFPSLSTVATSGSYSDLSNKPSIPSSSSDLSDGSSLVKTSSTTGLIKNDGSVDTNSYLTTSSASSTYQTKLVSGTSIKTINNESLLGSGNITIQGGSSVDVVTSWEATLSDTKVPSEKLTKNTIDGKLDNALSSTVVTIASNDDILITDYSDSNKIKRVANILASQMKDSNAHSNIGSSANDTQATINTDIDTALGNKVSKSSTTGLLKNDGSVDTNTYLTSSAISGMLTTSDVANNLTTTTSGKVLDARQGKALADLIGDAIAYINQ